MPPEQLDRLDRSLLHIACIAGNLAIVKYLRKYNLDARSPDADAMAPIHHAIARGHDEIVTHLLQNYEDLATLLDMV